MTGSLGQEQTSLDLEFLTLCYICSPLDQLKPFLALPNPMLPENTPYEPFSPPNFK